MGKTLVSIVLLITLSNLSKAQKLDQVISFMKDNPKKASIYLVENDKVTINYNSSQVMPLASAVKTIIAIEFAKQVYAGKIAVSTVVPVKDLNQYYLPYTDGNAHPAWLNSINRKEADSVTLLQVAQGMIRFSSNANTEYLEDLLGLNNINSNIKTLGLKAQQPLYYFTAGALITCLKPEGTTEAEWLKTLTAMPAKAYIELCNKNHERLKNDPSFIKTYNPVNLPLSVQKIWSDRLVGGTTSEYAGIMQKINSRSYFDKGVQVILESLMEWPMAYPAIKASFLHVGQKGGSTSYIQTDALYFTDKNNNKVACAFFFNDLTTEEQKIINSNFPAFEAGILLNAAFRENLVKSFQ